jgi:predicted NBD/HSP70 family sugar kinase
MSNLPEKATHRQTRTFNQQLVLRAIYGRTEISRAELARLTGLTRTSVSALVAELLRDGLVEEIGRGPSTGGKAPIMLRVNPDGRHAIGLDLGASKFSGALVDMRGGVVKSAQVELDGRNGADAVEALYGLIDSLIRRNGTSSLLGVGIGTPGLVDSRQGIVRWSVNLDWTDLPLASMVAERLGLPVVVANDSQAAAFAESTFGSIPWPHNLIVVRVGLGIGAGIILEGKLFQGDGSGAGEIGHSIFGQVAQAGRPERCRCGRVGCLETVASMSAMVKAAHRAVPAIKDEQSLIDAFHSGQDDIHEIVLAAARMLGEGIAAMIASLNINHVLIIGPATHLGLEYLSEIRRQAQKSALPLLSQQTQIELGETRGDDIVIGASAMLMTQELGLSLAR